MQKSGRGKSPNCGSEDTGYGPDVHAMLDEIPYPNDDSNYSMNYSPGYAGEKDRSSASTPAPRTPNEPATDQSYPPSKDSTMEKHLVKRNLQEPASTLSHIEESDLSSISNVGVGTSQLNIFPAQDRGEASGEASGDVSGDNSGYALKSSEHSKYSRRGKEGDSVVKEETKVSEERAAVFPKYDAPSVNITEGNEPPEEYPAQSKRVECEESLSLTPSYTSHEKGWTFTPQEISTQRREAYEEDTQSPDFYSNQEDRKKTLSRAARAGTKKNLDEEIEKQIGDVEYLLSEDFHQLKFQLSEANIRMRQLSEENLELKSDLESKFAELLESADVINELRAKTEEQNEHLALLQQHRKDDTKLHLLRGQLLESAKMEISQLRIYIQERDKKVAELELALSQRDSQDRAEAMSMMKEIENLCLEVQKYKIKSNAISKHQQQLEEAYKDLQERGFDVQNGFEGKCKELSERTRALEGEKAGLEEQLRKFESVSMKEKRVKESLQRNTEELKAKYEQAFQELNEAKEQISELEGAGIVPIVEGQHAGYVEQLNVMKEQNARKMALLNGEVNRLKEEVSRKAQRISELERKGKVPEVIGDDCVKCAELAGSLEQALMELGKIRQWLDVKEDEYWEPRMEEVLAEVDAGQLIKVEFERIQSALQETQRARDELEELLLEERQRPVEPDHALHKKLKELESNYEKCLKSKNLAQAQLTNSTSILKEKEQEIAILRQSRDLAENNEKSVRDELEEVKTQLEAFSTNRETDMMEQAFARLIDFLSQNLAFSFIHTEYPVLESMSDKEKIAQAEALQSTIQILRDNIEAHNEANIANIAHLKEQIKMMEGEIVAKQNLVESHAKCTESLELEKAHLVAKIAQLGEELQSAVQAKSEFEQTWSSAKRTETGEADRLRRQIEQERKRGSELMAQKDKLHRDELEAASSSKLGTVKQLEARLGMLEEKLKRKKDKAIATLNESETLLRKQEELMLEGDKLRGERDKVLKQCSEQTGRVETLRREKGELETALRLDKEHVQSLALEKAGLEEDLQHQVETVATLRDELEYVAKQVKPAVRREHKQTQADTHKELQTLTTRLDASEKALKLSQQRLQVAYEENNRKLQELGDALARAKARNKELEDENVGLKAECERINKLLEQAKMEMKRMMSSSRMMGGSYAVPALPLGRIQQPQQTQAQSRTPALEVERIAMTYEDQLSAALNLRATDSELQLYADEDKMHEFVQTLDEVVRGGDTCASNTGALGLTLKDKVATIRHKTELVYKKEIESLQKQIMRLTQTDLSKLMSIKKSHSLQESIEILKESLCESEKCMEESVQKRVRAERRRIRDEIRRTVPREDCSGKLQLPDSTRSRKQGLPPRMASPARLSPAEQQMRRELDEEVCCGTNRTISFGAPEPAEQDLDPIEDDGQCIDEFKREIEDHKAVVVQEWKLKLEAAQAEVKEHCDDEISKMQAEHKIELELLKKELGEKERAWRGKEEMIKQAYDEQIARLEQDKDREVDELVRLREEQMKADSNIQLLRAVNEKRDELTKQYLQNKEQLQREFEQLKQKLNSEVEGRSGRIEAEYSSLLRDQEEFRAEIEKRYAERGEEKEQLVEEIMKMRIKEIEEEYKLKADKLEYNLKYEAQCQTERQRAELTGEQKEIEEKFRRRADEAESRLRAAGSEYRGRIEQLERDIVRMREECEVKCESARRNLEKDLGQKLSAAGKKCKDAEERCAKLQKQLEECERKLQEDRAKALEQLQRRARDEAKATKDKHAAEVRSIREAHRNETIKKGIEKDREIKRLTETYNAQLEQLSKSAMEPPVKNEAPKEQKKEGEKQLQQKITALRRKLESEYQEKERSMKEEVEKSRKECEVTVKAATHSEKLLRERMSQQFESKLREEVNKLKEKYQMKKQGLETLRVEYEGHLRAAMKENRMRDANSSVKARPDTTLSEIDTDEIIKENEERLRVTEKQEYERRKTREQYEVRIHKLESELETMTSRRENRVFDTLQTYTEILTLELDKLLQIVSSPSKDHTGTIQELNHTISKLLVSLTGDSKCSALLESFKIKLNSVILAFRTMLEAQFASKGRRVAQRDVDEEEEEDRKSCADEVDASDIKKYFEAMDANYQSNVLTRVAPVQNSAGKYVVDVEKVVRDLLLVRDALYSVFHKADGAFAKELEGTNCTITEEMARMRSTAGSTQTVIDNIAKHYRILLNTILRFAVEAAWMVNEGVGKRRGPGAETVESEEILKLKLINAELREHIGFLEQEKLRQRKKLAIFVGDDSGLLS